MKKLALSFCLFALLGTVVLAGSETYSSKNYVAPAPCPQWYADNEFNLTLSGVYAFTQDPWIDDTYLRTDHGWGGALDAKYFMHRYFGFGVQGFIVSARTHDVVDFGLGRIPLDNEDSHAVGGVLGTFTLRYPISCSRFAPYVWVGGGGIFGGGQDHDFVVDPAVGLVRREFDQSDSRGIAQVGGGIEIRFTPHFGWTNDFSWNIVSGPNNNFGMARTGLNFAF